VPTALEIPAHVAIQTPSLFAYAASGGRWLPRRHLSLIDELFVRALNEQVFGIVEMPPRHGKSELGSKYAPAWYIGKRPDRRVILTSYEAGFAATWGGKARDLLHEFGGWFDIAVKDDSTARNAWGIEGREGGMVTAGVPLFVCDGYGVWLAAPGSAPRGR